MRLFTLIPLLLLCLTKTVGQSRPQQLDTILKELAKEDHFSGNLLLAEGGKIILSGAYGMADRESKRMLDENSIFELASVSKQFTAAGISLLAADGKIDLDDPISKHLPELANYPEVTIRQLVHHTAGLPDYMGFLETFGDHERTQVNQDVLNILRDQKPEVDFEAGTQFSYSNTGYLVLASLIERLSGKSFGAFLKSRIFEPLGMKNTLVYQRRYAPQAIDNYALGYVFDGREYALPDSLEDYSFVPWWDGIVGDGMVNSTLHDLFLWDRALARGELLDTALVLNSGFTTDGEEVGYAFGWATGQHPERGRLINHSGGWPGYNTFIYRFPDSDRTMILLRNDSGGKGIDLKIRQSALNVLFDEDFELEIPQPIAETPISAAALAAFEGVFAVMPEFKLRFFEQDGQLITQATDQPELELAYLGQDRFKLRVVDAQVQFHRDEEGKVTSLTLFQNGQEVSAQKE